MRPGVPPRAVIDARRVSFQADDLDVTVEATRAVIDLTLVSRRTGQRVELQALARVEQDAIVAEARRQLGASS